MGLVTGLLIGAAALGAVSSIKAGQAANKQAKFEAGIQQQQAARERQVAAGTESDFRRRQSRLQAQRRAALGASGVRSGTGSPLLAAGDFAAEVELAALRIREGGEIRSTRLEQQAELTRRAGRNVRTRGFFRAGSSLLSGVGQAFR
jgi:hypothetical protein